MNDDNLDLLDLDDSASMDALPDATPFATPRPKKPWLLLGIGIIVIILATYIIIRAIGDDTSSSMEVNLDAPAIVVDGDVAPVPADTLQVPPQAAQPVMPPQQHPQPMPAQEAPQPKPQPAQQAAPVQPTAGVPVRVIEDRKDVSFNPEKPVAPKPQAKQPAKKPAAQQAKPAAKKPQPKPQAVAHGGWYVQFGSYSTRALAENAERQIRAAHRGLFEGKQFVILAAQLQNGTTTYRLRIAFATANDANGFCRNAKSDGLDCYVAK